MWYKNKLVIFLLVVVLVAGGLVLFKGNGEKTSSAGPETVVNSQPQSGEITVNGTISCLPYVISIEGESCVKALKGDDGKVYALNSLKVGGKESQMSEGTKVTAIGTFDKADTSVDDAKVFKYDGVLNLRVLNTR